MIVGKLHVRGSEATAEILVPLTSGMAGVEIELTFADDVWQDLAKTVVFRSCCTKDVTVDGSVVEIPAEVLARPRAELAVGIYGTGANGLVVPTAWANFGTIKDGADPSGDPAADPSLPVWAQLAERVSALEKGGGSVSPEYVGELVDTYLEENPPAAGEPGPQGPAGPQGPQGEQGEPGYTPVKGVDYYTDADKQEMVAAVLEALPAAEGGSY